MGTQNQADGDLGKEQSSSTKNSTSTDNLNTPGRRLKNPLGYFSSSTYQISLYMITPDAYDAFVLSGRKNINALNNVSGNETAGAYLIAQSGGRNARESKIAEGMQLDYYIDNLTIKTYASAKATQTATNTTEIKFQIIEPYGFSFITKLRHATDALQRYIQTVGNSKPATTQQATAPENPTRQFFVIGVRFLGYDETGKLVAGNDVNDNTSLDPNASNLGVFDRYYDIIMTNIKFKIDGGATTYNIEAASIPPRIAFGMIRGRLNNGASIKGTTVVDALQGKEGLLTKLNAMQQNVASQNDVIPNTFAIKWIGEDVDKLMTAKIVTSADTDKSRLPGNNVQNTSQVNDAASATAVPKVDQKEITFKNDTSVLQAISQIISQSTYLQDAMTVVNQSTKEPNATTGQQEVQRNSNPASNIAWYNISAIVSNARWEPKISDFVYDITYVIQTYQTPVITSAFTSNGAKYYGPHKRYEYWYTGKNSEILDYEQTINNGYFNIGSENDLSKGKATLGNSDVPLIPNMRTDGSRIGGLDVFMEKQNAYITSLYDPGSFAQAKIKILGDPDFLMEDSPGNIDEVYSRFYGSDGVTINPRGGQVFIEINFKEAIDYSEEDGLLKVNDSILFWKYPETIASQVKGVSYQVITVNSTFQDGMFTQTLECVINTFGDADTPNGDKTRETRTPNQANGPSPGANNTTGTSDGFIKHKVPAATSNIITDALPSQQLFPYRSGNTEN